jgi:NAD(P)-dependent dehydrogenase (short-subunit alcohol dehydrogenase family)
VARPDARVTPLTVDVTDSAQIQEAVEKVESVDILINNAGLALYDDLTGPGPLEQQLAVNLFGTYSVTRAPAGHAPRWVVRPQLDIRCG